MEIKMKHEYNDANFQQAIQTGKIVNLPNGPIPLKKPNTKKRKPNRVTTEINAQIFYLETEIACAKVMITNLKKQANELTNSEEDLCALSLINEHIGRWRGELYANEKQLSFLKQLINTIAN